MVGCVAIAVLQIVSAGVAAIFGVAAISSAPPPRWLFVAAQCSPIAFLAAWVLLAKRWRTRWAWSIAALLSAALPIMVVLAILIAALLP